MAQRDEQQESARVVSGRPVVDVDGAVGGWSYPWPNVAELAAVLAAYRWTLIGGLMAQMHAIHRGIDAVRPTNDVDIVLHVETERGTPSATVAALERIGYQMLTSRDPLNPTAHRFTRGTSRIDVIAGDTAREASEDQIDVVIADHPAPSVEEPIRRMKMVKIEGGTQALKRTANYWLEITPGRPTTISVPRPFGALVLKAAAYKTTPEIAADTSTTQQCSSPASRTRSRSGTDSPDRTGLVCCSFRAICPRTKQPWRRMPREDARRAQQVRQILCAD